jgi:hypothetical protein
LPLDPEAIGRKRFTFLSALYEMVNGIEGHPASMWDVAKRLEIDETELPAITAFLKGAGLIGNNGGVIALTHTGLLEVEQARRSPERGTEHFSPINIINIQNMQGSQIQQGTYASEQRITILPSLEEVKEFVRELRASLPNMQLPAEDLGELNAELATLEAQANSTRPRWNAIKESLSIIQQLGIGIGANAAFHEILKHWPNLFR